MASRFALTIVILITGLVRVAEAQTGRLIGHINYPDAVQLGKTAVLEVTLEDVSDAATGVVIGTTRIPRPGQTPVMFSISYDAARVLPAHHYAVRALIVDAGATVLETDKPVRVLTQGTGSVAQVTLVQSDSRPNVEPAKQNLATKVVSALKT